MSFSFHGEGILKVILIKGENRVRLRGLKKSFKHYFMVDLRMSHMHHEIKIPISFLHIRLYIRLWKWVDTVLLYGHVE
ncbi:MAG TPA: hypothetical protein DET40_25440 [Lentisphaeria bacterium]|nr:MAG: hypothetical protein A2X45_18525 [Lentisphaerae bacterium GWF2_50_93]HCE46905.1 hypothetical protein [Lentisphaeria bacterium]